MLRIWFRDDDGSEAYRDKDADSWQEDRRGEAYRLYRDGQLVAVINSAPVLRFERI